MNRAPLSAAACLWTGALLLLAAPQAGASQEPAAPELRGTVTVGSDRPVPSAMVTLHRVDAVDAGEIDSIAAGVDGTFRFDLPTVPDPGGRGEVYFASVRHQGVLYFGPPVTAAVELDSVYRIQVYDTAVAPMGGAPLTPSVRYILVEEGQDGWQVTDLFQLVVEGDRTLVAADSGITWRYPLPPSHRDLQVGGGDVPPATTRVEEGYLLVSAPLPPGPRQLVVRYTVDSLTVDIPLPGGVAEMDLLVREPAPPVQVQGLVPAESVEMEPGVRYRRFSGVGVPSTTLRMIQEEAPFVFPVRWLAVVLGLVLAGVGVYVVRRAPGGAPPAGPAPGRAPERGPTREELVREVAGLDDALEVTPEGPARERMLHRRRVLVAALRQRG
ncbi:MAG TPA: hypothetical protein VLA43_18885 [Longimicrobiales bacterium]|nr:hypothetical protein [Longimicrobiales bacterium]